MKKRLFIIVGLFVILLTGCNTDLNTPTSRVEEFFSKYQNLDADVLTKLDSIIASDDTMTDEEKKDYTNLMKRQYQNISYKIKDEKTEKNTSTVFVEVEVFDYRSALDNSDKYYENNKEKFIGDNNKLDNKKYMDYKITELKKVNDRRKYDIVFTLNKLNNSVWVLNDISTSDIEKIHGLYRD